MYGATLAAGPSPMALESTLGVACDSETTAGGLKASLPPAVEAGVVLAEVVSETTCMAASSFAAGVRGAGRLRMATPMRTLARMGEDMSFMGFSL